MFFVKLNNALKKIETVFGTLFLVCIFFLLMTNVVMRYVFSNAIRWSDEINGYMFCWFGFLSAAYGMSNDSHVRITIFEDIVKKKTSSAFRIVFDVLIIVGIILMFKPTIRYMSIMTVTPALRWPLEPIFSITLISYVLFILHTIVDMYFRIHFIKTGEDLFHEDVEQIES